MAELVLGTITTQKATAAPVQFEVPPQSMMSNGQYNTTNGQAEAAHTKSKSILFGANNPLAHMLFVGNGGLTALSVTTSGTIPSTHSGTAAVLLANGNVAMRTNNISTSWNRSNIIFDAAQAMVQGARHTSPTAGAASAPKTPAKAKPREADNNVSLKSKKRSCPGNNPSESTTTSASSSTCGEAKRKLSKGSQIVVKSTAPPANPLQTTASTEATKSKPESKPKLGEDAGTTSVKPIKGKRQCFQFTMSGLVPKNDLPKRIYKKPMERPKTPTQEFATNEKRAEDHTPTSSPRHHASDASAALNQVLAGAALGRKAQNCGSPGAVQPTLPQSTKPPLQPQTPMLISTLSPAVPRPEKSESSTPWYQQKFSGTGASIMTTPRKNKKMFCQFQSDSPGLALVADAAIISSSRDKEERNRKKNICDTGKTDVLEKSEKRSLAIALPTLPDSISGRGLGLCPPIRSLKMRRHPRSEIGPGSIC